MRLAYFTKQVAQNGHTVLEAFLSGCRTLGIETVENSLDCDAAVIWSMVWSGRMAANRSVYEHYKKLNRPVFVLEVGMLHRDRTWKLGINGTTAQAQWVSAYDHRRHLKLGLVAKHWQKPGKEILLAGQRTDSGQWGSVDAMAWYLNVVDTVAQHSDRPLILRPHPRFPLNFLNDLKIQRPKKLINTYDGFDFDNGIRNAWAVINFNSGPGSQAVMSGVPAFVDRSSLAAPVANLDLADIESPAKPDREQWLLDLAHTEWTVSELAAGVPQKRLFDRV